MLAHRKTSVEKLQKRFPANVVRNQKYNVFTFLPLVFYEQFKFFFNLYFLLVALSQFVPALKIGTSCQCCHYVTHVNIVGRLHRDLCRAPCLCSMRDYGKGGL